MNGENEKNNVGEMLLVIYGLGVHLVPVFFVAICTRAWIYFLVIFWRNNSCFKIVYLALR